MDVHCFYLYMCGSCVWCVWCVCFENAGLFSNIIVYPWWFDSGFASPRIDFRAWLARSHVSHARFVPQIAHFRIVAAFWTVLRKATKQKKYVISNIGWLLPLKMSQKKCFATAAAWKLALWNNVAMCDGLNARQFMHSAAHKVAALLLWGKTWGFPSSSVHSTQLTE